MAFHLEGKGGSINVLSILMMRMIAKNTGVIREYWCVGMIPFSINCKI